MWNKTNRQLPGFDTSKAVVGYICKRESKTMTDKAYTLQVQNLSVSFTGIADFEALQDVSFEIEKGKSLALLGASGSGKSVTSLAVMGLLPKKAIQKGSIFLEGEKLSQNTNWQGVRGGQVAMIFQEPMSALNPLMTCGSQIMETITTHQVSISKKAAYQQVIFWMHKVQLPQPENLFHKYPHELSGGQKQRIMIAMALCNKPKLIIADEPTTALDVLVQLEILKLLQSLQKEYQLSLLFITHDMGVASWIADDVCILEEGKVVSRNLADYKKNFVLQSSPDLSAVVVEEPFLELKNLSVDFVMKKNWLGKPQSVFRAVDNVSFTIQKGKTLGLVGGSGSGKSTISKCIMGIVPATEGTITFDGTGLHTLTAKGWKTMRKDIQMIFQDPHASLSPRMNVVDMLQEVLQVHRIVKGHKEQLAYIRQLLDKVGLPQDALKKYPHEFSGGQKQRLCIARAMVVQPRFIICDESIAALDTKMQYQILNLLKKLQETDQLTYLFITHDLKIAEHFCDDIVVLQHGKLVEQGIASQILQNPQNVYTQALKEAIL